MIIDNEKLQRTLESAKSHTDAEVADILNKARLLKGISLEEAAVLLNITDKKLLNDLFAAAKYVKEAIYGNRIVLFAPLYISNICIITNGNRQTCLLRQIFLHCKIMPI